MNMTWSEVVDAARVLRDQFRVEGSVAWFRGHRREEWLLKSSAHRHVERLIGGATALPSDALVELLREETKTLYRRFKAEAWSLLHERERSDWGVLFTMQHYAIPTRLLDWSESFACAVFFAQLNRSRTESAAIWVLDAHAINRATINRDGILALDEEPGAGALVDPRSWHPKWKSSVALHTLAAAPIFSNPRMVAQQSAFLLTGDSFDPLDQQFPGLVSDRRLVKLVLSPETYDDVNEFLESAGLTAFSFYPDLDGLALKHEHRAQDTIRKARELYPHLFN